VKARRPPWIGRKADGESPADAIGNAGDDLRKELGNAGDDVRRENWKRSTTTRPSGAARRR
jgi:hypothetical protein